MFERMGMSKDSVMIIHGGGMYDGKTEALQRFSTVYKGLPSNIKERLVLENDEICFNCDDLLPICEELNIPLVLDYHHDSLFPSTLPVAQLMPRILATWSRKGIKPKQHLSEARRGAVTLMVSFFPFYFHFYDGSCLISYSRHRKNERILIDASNYRSS